MAGGGKGDLGPFVAACLIWEFWSWVEEGGGKVGRGGGKIAQRHRRKKKEIKREGITTRVFRSPSSRLVFISFIYLFIYCSNQTAVGPRHGWSSPPGRGPAPGEPTRSPLADINRMSLNPPVLIANSPPWWRYRKWGGWS